MLLQIPKAYLHPRVIFTHTTLMILRIVNELILHLLSENDFYHEL